VARPLDEEVRPCRRSAAPVALLGAVLIALASACRAERAAPADAPTPAVARPIESPAAPGSGEPSLAATADGRVILSWLEPRDGGRHALRFSSRRAGEPWSVPHTVAEGASWFVNWADFPRLAALGDGTLFAHWLEKNPAGGSYQYDVQLVRSTDGGATWSSPVHPYREAIPSEHGFVSFAPATDDRMGVLFLDGRETARKQGSMTLRFATWGRSGVPETDAPVDPRVCDCCQTAIARTTRGLVIAYRDRSADEVRDIAVRRHEGGRWLEPAYPGAEGWRIDACPVNGPVLAAEGDRVALAWFSMAGERAVVKAALSGDSGASWSPPVTIDDADPLGRVDAVLTVGAALVSWLAPAPDGAEVRVRAVRGDGTAGPTVVVARTSGARASGFPQMEHAGGEVVMAWRDGREPARIHTATVEVGE